MQETAISDTLDKDTDFYLFDNECIKYIPCGRVRAFTQDKSGLDVQLKGHTGWTNRNSGIPGGLIFTDQINISKIGSAILIHCVVLCKSVREIMNL